MSKTAGTGATSSCAHYGACPLLTRWHGTADARHRCLRLRHRWRRGEVPAVAACRGTRRMKVCVCVRVCVHVPAAKLVGAWLPAQTLLGDGGCCMRHPQAALGPNDTACRRVAWLPGQRASSCRRWRAAHRTRCGTGTRRGAASTGETARVCCVRECGCVLTRW